MLQLISFSSSSGLRFAAAFAARRGPPALEQIKIYKVAIEAQAFRVTFAPRPSSLALPQLRLRPAIRINRGSSVPPMLGRVKFIWCCDAFALIVAITAFASHSSPLGPVSISSSRASEVDNSLFINLSAFNFYYSADHSFPFLAGARLCETHISTFLLAF